MHHSGNYVDTGETSICFFRIRSRREWSRRESSDIDEARKGEFSGENESIEALTRAGSQRVSNSQNHRNRSRRESNPHFCFRRLLAGEIRILDKNGAVERIILFDEADRKL
jgi:hypothetical protein